MTRTSPSHNTTSHNATSHNTRVTPGTHLPVNAAVKHDGRELLRVDVQVDPGGTTVLRVIGEIDLATSPLLRSQAMSRLAEAPRQLVLDLRRVGFLGSAGLAVLVDIRGDALRRDIDLRLRTASPAVLRPLIATSLIELFDVDTGESPEHPPRQGGN